MVIKNLLSNINKMYKEEWLWRNKFEKIALDIIWDKDHYFKEKWWRFDVNVYDTLTNEQFDKIINDVEYESELCCQECAKHRYQIWTEWWWIQHFCIPCYLKKRVKYLCKKFRFYIESLWVQIRLKDTTAFTS